MALPEIRFRPSRLIYDSISKPLVQLWNQDNDDQVKLPGADFIKSRVQSYEQAWWPIEEKILTGMCEVFDLSFYLPVIDISLAPRIPTFSTPFLMNLKYEPDEAVDIITHELLHILLSDNKEGVDLGAYLEQHYAQEPLRARNHVLVHAGLKHIYLDVLAEPVRLERDISRCAQRPDYKRAWDIVEATGYKELIRSFKNSYGA